MITNLVDCDTCENKTDKPNTISIKHWNGKEVSVFCCDFCIYAYTVMIEKQVRTKELNAKSNKPQKSNKPKKS